MEDKISIGTEVDKSDTTEFFPYFNKLFHITNPEGVIQIEGTGSKNESDIPIHMETSENIGKIVYVIGKSGDFSHIDDLAKILGIEKDSGTEIICVQSPEQIPFEERLKQDLSIQEVHTIKKLPVICEKIQTYFPDKKRKGHERPYKYHR